jgi:hypothetical protein
MAQEREGTSENLLDKRNAQLVVGQSGSSVHQSGNLALAFR